MIPGVIEKFITQHAEEAAFLWLLRDNAVSTPHYSLEDLIELDDRVEAHLDGLREAGETGMAIAMDALQTGDAGEVFAAAVGAFENGDGACIKAVLEIAEENPEYCPGLVSALGWLPFGQAEPHITGLLAAKSPFARGIGLAAAVVHLRDPGQPLVDALTGKDPLPRARALEAIGRLGRTDLLDLARRNLEAEDDLCRFNASWSAALLGDRNAAFVLKTFVRPDWPWREEALKIAMRRMSGSSALTWHVELAGDPETRRLAVIGAGAIGDPVLAPWLIERMKTPELTRVAGEALTMITGVDIAGENLEGEWPEGFETGPNDDPEDENVAMDPDENLPWPNPELLTGWWEKNRGRFTGGSRYLLGKPIIADNLRQILRTGLQRQRYAAALELAMIKPGQTLFEVRAPGLRQKRILDENGLTRVPFNNGREAAARNRRLPTSGFAAEGA